MADPAWVTLPKDWARILSHGYCRKNFKGKEGDFIIMKPKIGFLSIMSLLLHDRLPIRVFGFVCLHMLMSFTAVLPGA